MSFKFLRGTEEFRLYIEPMLETTLRFNNDRIDNNEYCFQFDDDEPVVFAHGSNDLTITISPTENANIMFGQEGGRTFKIFARERINE